MKKRSRYDDEVAVILSSPAEHIVPIRVGGKIKEAAVRVKYTCMELYTFSILISGQMVLFRTIKKEKLHMYRLHMDFYRSYLNSEPETGEADMVNVRNYCLCYNSVL